MRERLFTKLKEQHYLSLIFKPQIYSLYDKNNVCSFNKKQKKKKRKKKRKRKVAMIKNSEKSMKPLLNGQQ